MARHEWSGWAHNPPSVVKRSFEETLTEVWRQALIENADVVVLGAERYSVRLTPKRHLRQVDFVFDGNEIRGLAEPRYEIPLGANGTGWQEGDAVPQRGSLRCERGRWQGELLRPR